VRGRQKCIGVCVVKSEVPLCAIGEYRVAVKRTMRCMARSLQLYGPTIRVYESAVSCMSRLCRLCDSVSGLVGRCKNPGRLYMLNTLYSHTVAIGSDQISLESTVKGYGCGILCF
jgi:hypothetical protein